MTPEQVAKHSNPAPILLSGSYAVDGIIKASLVGQSIFSAPGLRRAIPFALAITALLSGQTVSVMPASAQAERAFHFPGAQVVAVDEGRDHHSLTLRVENGAVPGRPTFRYMAGDRGETVLTADFPGLSWTETPKIIRVNSPENGLTSGPGDVKEVRVAQFVESPAVLRLSFVARDARTLKKISIGAAAGVLKVSWGGEVAARPESNAGSKPLVARGQMPKAELPKVTSAVASAPDHSSSSSSSEEAPAPPIAQRLNRTAEASDSAVAFKTISPVARTTQKGADNNGDTSIDKTPLPEARDAMQDEPAPTLSLVTCDAGDSGAKIEILRVEMTPGKDISFKGFRMHDPERYVIDIPNCRGLANATLPDLANSSLVSSLRVGLPNQSQDVGRLVLQLADNGVNVAGSYTPGSNYLTVTIGKGLMIGAESGTVEKFSGAEIAPGPIVVPRAPSETVIVLDAGHGGTDPGAMRADIQEKDLTLAIIEKLKKILETKGARIVLTRHDDTFVSLEDRVKICNQVGPNLFLSVHINSLESTSNIYGIETYFQTELSRPLAERVHASLVSGLSEPDRNIRRARFYVINHTPVPAILAEVGYITNKAERDRLASPEYQQKVASALARGVMLYLQDTGAGGGQLANKAHTN